MKRLLLVIYMLSMCSLCWAQAPSLGPAASFSVLGGQAVTCTTSVITGDVGVSPTPAFTNTGCTIAGGTPPGTDAAAALARTAFLSAYNAIGLKACTQTFSTLPPVLPGLAPGVYCFPAAVTGTLTLDGFTNPNGIWIFKVPAGFTGTGFQVVMANGGQACNVFWSVGAGATLTDSLFQGSILAGDATLGSITITRGSLIGRALANVAVTLTSTNIHGSCALLAQAAASCTDNDDHHHEKDKDRDHDKDNDKDRDHGKDKDKDHDKDKDSDH